MGPHKSFPGTKWLHQSFAGTDPSHDSPVAIETFHTAHLVIFGLRPKLFPTPLAIDLVAFPSVGATVLVTIHSIYHKSVATSTPSVLHDGTFEVRV